MSVMMAKLTYDQLTVVTLLSDMHNMLQIIFHYKMNSGKKLSKNVLATGIGTCVANFSPDLLDRCTNDLS